MKWEYKVIPLEELQQRFGDSYQKILNIQGNDGWELVSVDDTIAYFKRPIEEQHATTISTKPDSAINYKFKIK